MINLLLDTTFLVDAERGGDHLDDLIIVATARATGRVVLTADAAAFSDLPDVAVRSHR